MIIVLVTGSAGLIGSESARFFCDHGFTVVGIDNNMRSVFFGADASTEWNRDRLLEDYGEKYIHHAEVYNIGGSRFSNCSMLEAIGHCEAITDKKLNWSYVESNRIGDHIWWISDVQKFKNHYPDWELTYTVTDILKEIFGENVSRWS